MTDPVQTLREALYGNPPVADYKPSREGTLAAFTALADTVEAIGTAEALTGVLIYNTLTAMNLDLTPVANKLAIVISGGNALYRKIGGTGTGSWVATGLAFNQQPLIDRLDDTMILVESASQDFVFRDGNGFVLASLGPTRVRGFNGSSGGGGGGLEKSSAAGGLVVTDDDGYKAIESKTQTFRADRQNRSNTQAVHNAAPQQRATIRKMLANVRNGVRQRMAIAGDSITMPYFGSTDAYFGIANGRKGSWVNHMARIMTAQGLPCSTQSWAGGGNCEQGGTGFSGPGGTLALNDADPRITIPKADGGGAGWLKLTSLKTVGGYVYSSNGDLRPLVFTPEKATKSYEFWIANSGVASTADLQIDGVTVSSVSVGAGAGFTRYTVTAASEGMHTYGVKSQSAAVVRVAGGIAMTTAPELDIINMGWAGASTRDWLLATNPWQPLNALRNLAINHVTLAIGVNDWMSRTYTPGDIIQASETFTNLVSIGQALQTAGIGVNFVVPFPSRFTAQPLSIQAPYMEAVRNAGRRLNVGPILDLPQHFGVWDRANSQGFVEDNVHPNIIAQADMGALAARAYSL
jgi:lysophospholipase L1-like esterase